MSGLSEIAEKVKKVAIGIVVLIIVIIIFKFLFSLVYAFLIKKPTIVKTIPPPNMKFGKLPKPIFTGISTTADLQFTLQTVDGKPPETTAAAQVFIMPKKSSTLLASDRANRFASTLGFSKPPQIITSADYKYTDPNIPQRTLRLDIINMNYRLTYDYLSQGKAFFDAARPMTKDRIRASVLDMVKGQGIFHSSFINPRMTITNLAYNPSAQSFDTATSLSTANAVRFDFFRNDIAGLKTVPPDFNRSYTYVIYSYQPRSEISFLDVSYTYWPVSFETYATYPLISSSQAWQALQDGNAVVVHPSQTEDTPIVVRTISLAYFDSKDPQDYLQPIFVFEGDNGFVAYYPAISSDWYVE